MPGRSRRKGRPAAAGPDLPDPAPVPSGVTFERRATSPAGRSPGSPRRSRPTRVPGRVDLTLIGRYRLTGASDWIDMASQGGEAVAGPLNDGASYEAQIAWLSNTSVSDWSPTLSFAVSADTTAPGPPTGFVANGGSGQVAGAFTARTAATSASLASTAGPRPISPPRWSCARSTARPPRPSTGPTRARPGPIATGSAPQPLRLRRRLVDNRPDHGDGDLIARSDLGPCARCRRPSSGCRGTRCALAGSPSPALSSWSSRRPPE